MGVTKTSHHILVGLASLALTACMGEAPNPVDAFQAAIDEAGLGEIRRSPQTADSIGVDASAFGGPYKDKLDDRSMAARDRARVARLDSLAALEAIDASALSQEDRRDYQVIHFLLTADARLGRYGHGVSSLGGARPYAVTHLDGAYLTLPRFMSMQHELNVLADAQDYLSRLSQIPAIIEDERRHLQTEAAMGVSPPAFSLLQAAQTARGIAETPTDASAFLEPLVIGLSSMEGVDTDVFNGMVDKAKLRIETDIAPAYMRLAETFDALAASAGENGLQDLETGADYYRDALQLHTTTDLGAEEMHRIGLTLVEDTSLELDAMLAGAGFPDGAVGARLAALGENPDYRYPATPEGRIELLSALRASLLKIDAELPTFFDAATRANVELRAVPYFLEAIAPGGYNQPAVLKADDEGVFFVNLQDTAGRPAWILPTLAHHEAVPGRHFEYSLSRNGGASPLIRHLAHMPAFSAGWAVYAEDLADEMGVYDDDDLGRIGYLQSLLSRAAYLVADTGLHHYGWSRDDAVAYLIDATGRSRDAMTARVDRAMVQPGRACADIIGRETIRRLRHEADRALGPDFDLKAFHTLILSNGARPLGVLETDVRAWIAETQTAQRG